MAFTAVFSVLALCAYFVACQSDLKQEILPLQQRFAGYGHFLWTACYDNTPLDIVRNMLMIGQAEHSDSVLDLGSGDGRILFVASTEFFVSSAVGIDYDLQLVEESRRSLADIHSVSVHHLNIFDEAQSLPFFQRATLVTVWLNETVHKVLGNSLT